MPVTPLNSPASCLSQPLSEARLMTVISEQPPAEVACSLGKTLHCTQHARPCTHTNVKHILATHTHIHRWVPKPTNTNPIHSENNIQIPIAHAYLNHPVFIKHIHTHKHTHFLQRKKSISINILALVRSVLVQPQKWLW